VSSCISPSSCASKDLSSLLFLSSPLLRQFSTSTNSGPNENTSGKENTHKTSGGEEVHEKAKVKEDLYHPEWQRVRLKEREKILARQEAQSQEQNNGKSAWSKYERGRILVLGVSIMISALGAIGYSLYTWMKMFQEPRWIPQILIQHFLMDFVPIIQRDPTLERLYGPIAVHQTSISFQPFELEREQANGKKEIVQAMTLTFVLYQQKTGARVATVYIDFCRDHDYLTIENAYYTLVTGGTKYIELDEETQRKFYYNLHDPKYGEQGAAELVERNKQEEMRYLEQRRQQEEIMQRHQSGSPLRVFNN
jgi:hypothetical protein